MPMNIKSHVLLLEVILVIITPVESCKKFGMYFKTSDCFGAKFCVPDHSDNK